LCCKSLCHTVGRHIVRINPSEAYKALPCDLPHPKLLNIKVL